MKVSKFSEQQIALLLKQVDDGVSVEEVCQGRNFAADLLPVAQELRRADALRGAAPQAARRGEPTPEADGGRSLARQSHAAGRAVKKL